MKLSTKLSLGFGALVVLIAVLGIVAWIGLSRVSGQTGTAYTAAHALDDMRQLEVLRGRYLASTDATEAGDLKSQWKETYADMVTQMDSLDEGGLSAAQRTALEEARATSEQYE
ncbi:hypothetical protein EG835_12595, partial [bacterium]|nr:hypothetical protein [bacterium]